MHSTYVSIMDKLTLFEFLIKINRAFLTFINNVHLPYNDAFPHAICGIIMPQITSIETNY